MKKCLCSVDMGASSAKMMLYTFNGTALNSLDNIVFDNKPVYLHSSLYWNFLFLQSSLIAGLCKFNAEKKLDSIGIDTWGASFGFLNKKDLLAEPIFHYRDLRTQNALQKMEKVYTERELFFETGCRPARSYSLPQLFSIIQNEEDIIKYARTILFLPDLFSFFLCGEKTSELTFAGTTALLDIKNNVWSNLIFTKFGIPSKLFTPIIPAGTVKGCVLPNVSKNNNLNTKIRVIAVCSHDTASAVVSIPGFDDRSIYISFGTNINMGVECLYPCVTAEAFEHGLKNTGGFDGTNLLYKDFAAGWFINKLQKDVKTGRYAYSIEEINERIKRISTMAYIDVSDPELNNDSADIKKQINAFLSASGQESLHTDEEFLCCVYESIVLKIKDTVNAFQKIYNNRFNRIYIINGGSRNMLLSQLICDAVDMPAKVGNPDASLLGNALVQLYALKELGSISDMRTISAYSCKMHNLYPCMKAPNSSYAYRNWDEKFAQYIKIFTENKIEEEK